MSTKIGIVIFGLLIVVIAAPWGFVAVRTACSESGGTQIDRNIDSAGYFSAASGLSCSSCMRDVASHRFEYVDVRIESSRQADALGLVGYHRYQLATRPDERCEWWDGSRYASAPSQFGLDESQCIALYAVNEPTVSPFQSILVRRKKVTGLFGIELDMDEHKIVDSRTSDTIAVSRHYMYVTPIQSAFGVLTPTWQCSGQDYREFDPDAFRVKVLKYTNQGNNC